MREFLDEMNNISGNNTVRGEFFKSQEKGLLLLRSLNRQKELHSSVQEVGFSCCRSRDSSSTGLVTGKKGMVGSGGSV